MSRGRARQQPARRPAPAGRSSALSRSTAGVCSARSRCDSNDRCRRQPTARPLQPTAPSKASEWRTHAVSTPGADGGQAHNSTITLSSGELIELVQLRLEVGSIMTPAGYGPAVQRLKDLGVGGRVNKAAGGGSGMVRRQGGGIEAEKTADALLRFARSVDELFVTDFQSGEAEAGAQGLPNVVIGLEMVGQRVEPVKVGRKPIDGKRTQKTTDGHVARVA